MERESGVIFYSTVAARQLSDYGIQIPLLPERIDRTLAHIQSLPRLKKHLQKVDEKLVPTAQDFALVHDPAFLQQLFSQHEDQVQKLLLACYECILPDGRYHRFDPKKVRGTFLELREELLLEGAGTMAAVLELASLLKAEKFGWSFFLGGGMHHARTNGPSGFCLYNDIVVALAKLRTSLSSTLPFWVVDVDAHMGDGTASFGPQFSWLKTFSIHMARGWPLCFPNESQTALPRILPSTMDIPIESHEAGIYNQKLKAGLEKFLDLTGKPVMALVVLGADPFEGDALPSTSKLKLTLAQMLERDIFLHKFMQHHQIPVTYVMGGGYGEETWKCYAQFFDFLDGSAHFS